MTFPERVPREPVAGHRDFVEHPDPATPERQAAAAISQPGTESASEPAFTRVARPSSNPTSDPSDPQEQAWRSMSPSPALFPIGIGWAVCCGVGVWLFMRWRRERNKPINRLRRQAEQARRTAYELRGRVPDIPDEAARPVMGLSTVLLSLAVFLWQQSQSRSRSRSQEASERMGKAARQARQKVSDADWQQRLVLLKKRWNPSRLQLERG
jgi:hypothetical protein